ncbi:BON domain-containing protein, partial [Nonomuraea sp. NPDC052129]
EDILDRGLWVDTSAVVVQVRHGVVTLSGQMDRKTETAIAVRMTGRVNGVVDVIDELTWKHDDSTWEAR